MKNDSRPIHLARCASSIFGTCNSSSSCSISCGNVFMMLVSASFVMLFIKFCTYWNGEKKKSVRFSWTSSRTSSRTSFRTLCRTKSKLYLYLRLYHNQTVMFYSFFLDLKGKPAKQNNETKRWILNLFWWYLTQLGLLLFLPRNYPLTLEHTEKWKQKITIEKACFAEYYSYDLFVQ